PDAPRVDAGPSCGDGRIDPGEQCDDGNTAANDGCSSSCRIEAPAGAVAFHLHGHVTDRSDASNALMGHMPIASEFDGWYWIAPATPAGDTAPTVGQYTFPAGYGLEIAGDGMVWHTDFTQSGCYVLVVNHPDSPPRFHGDGYMLDSQYNAPL